MSRWVCVCAYDGGGFSGWQSQPKGDSVQDAIESRLKVIFKTLIRIHASGRTDAGVHAEGQVFHFDAEWKHGAKALKAALCSQLDRAIQIKSVRRASDEFHSRFSAVGKTYVYHLYLGDADPFERRYVWSLARPLDFGAMRSVAGLLQGTHDFKAFSAQNGDEKETTVRTLRRLEIAVRGKRVRITAESDGFLYKMVRTLVGTLVAVGEGRMKADTVASLLESKARIPLVPTAPAQGLRLVKVHYRNGAIIKGRSKLSLQTKNSLAGSSNDDGDNF